MRKVILVLVLVFAISFVKAQSGKNQIGIAFEVGLPMSDFKDIAKTGFGGSLKYLHGVGTAGQVTLTSGYTVYKAKDDVSTFLDHTSIIPILLGYRQNFSGAYIEPQAGYGIYGSKFGSESNSDGMFTWAIGVGFAMEQGLDIGARYQSGSKSGSTLSLIGLHLGYNFSLGGTTTSSK